MNLIDISIDSNHSFHSLSFNGLLYFSFQKRDLLAAMGANSNIGKVMRKASAQSGGPSALPSTDLRIQGSQGEDVYVRVYASLGP